MAKDIKDIKENTEVTVNKLLRTVKIELPKGGEDVDAQASVWDKIQLKKQEPTVSRKMYKLWQFTAVAASILCVSVLSFSLFFRAKPVDPTLVLLSNLTGDNQYYTLPDSSTVLLRPHSQISYIASKEKTREIALNGEGYFDIKTNPNRPFIIKTDAGDVRVLGTKFGLKASTLSMESELVLTSGKVEFIRMDKVFRVKPNQKILINKSTGDVDIRKVDTTFELSWMSDFIEFNKEPLINVMNCIADIHGVKIFVADSVLAQTRFTGKLSNSYEVEKILKDLSLIIDINYTYSNQTYRITQKQLNK